MLNFDTIEWTGPPGLREWLAKVVDPRHRQGIRYPLEQILLLCLAAVLAGQQSYLAIHDWIQH